MRVNLLLAVRLGIVQVRNLIILNTRLTRRFHARSTSRVHYRLAKYWQANAGPELLLEAGARNERTL